MKNRPNHPLASSIDSFIFYILLVLIPLVAVPYGGVEPWWKAIFQCAVFALAALSIITKLINSRPEISRIDLRLVWPILALVVFAFMQTLPFAKSVNGVGDTLSADPFQTWQFVIQLSALLTFGWLLAIHSKSTNCKRRLVETIIVVATASALFGLARASFQKTPGFGLAHLVPGYGYAQFINTNHFAFLMELALGLALGIAVSRGVRGKRLAFYLVAAVPMWLALVLSNSRGGILSILCQVLFLALLLGSGRGSAGANETSKTASRFARASRNLAVRAVLVLALLAGAVTTVVFVGGDPLVGRVDSLSSEMNRSVADTYTLRPAIWRATWKMIKDHPIAGVGFGGYWIAISGYHDASGETTPQEAHNDYLELLASGGIIGVAIGIWFAFALIKTAKDKLARLRTNADSFDRAATLGALAGILTVAIHSLVDFGLHITINAVVFTALVALIVECPKSKVQCPKSNVQSPTSS